MLRASLELQLCLLEKGSNCATVFKFKFAKKLLLCWCTITDMTFKKTRIKKIEIGFELNYDDVQRT